MTHRRTVIHIDGIRGDGHVYCTVGGIALPPAALEMQISDFPESMRGEVMPGKVFFAQANLSAESADEIDLRDIEPEWGDPTFPLHFG